MIYSITKDTLATGQAFRRAWPRRFSLAFLLFVVLVISGSLAGYRIGRRAGYDAGWEQHQNEQLVAVAYPVGDLLSRQGPAVRTDFDSLIKTITSTVQPTTWEKYIPPVAGPRAIGPGTVTVVHTKKALVIQQSGYVHQEIAALLASLRERGARRDGTADGAR